MNAATRSAVWERAGSRCEYCRLHQSDDPFPTFHVEHVIAVKHGGTDSRDNLALACHRCNLSKGPNLAGRDRSTGQLVPLFNPRRQDWRRHFRFNGSRIAGRTKCGRVTVAVLKINHPERVALGTLLIRTGDWPPD